MSNAAWVKEPLGSLVSFEYGKGLPTEVRTNQGYPVLGSSGVVGHHSNFLVEGPGIVIGRKGTVGSITWIDTNFWPIDTTYYIEPKRPLDIRWIYWKLQTLRLHQLDSSTGVPGLNRNDAYEFLVEYPEFKEQRRIAKILDTLDNAIQKTEQLIAKLKQIKQGLLHDLLTRGIDENGQLRNPIAHPEQFKDSVLGRIPKEWEVKKISEICRLGRGRVISQIEVAEHPGVYPVYSSQSKDGGVFGYIDTYDFEGDYVTWTTDGAYAGTVFHRKGKFNCTNVCGTLQARSQEIVMEYLAIALARETFKHVSYIGNPKLMNNIMAQIAIALPPEHEQEAIVQALSAHDAREKKEAELLRKYHNLKKGLMHDLLTGKVRVNIDKEQG